MEGEEKGERGVSKNQTVHYLVDKWATLNLGRALVTGLAAILATVAAMEKVQVRELKIGPSGVQKVGRWWS